MAPTSLNTLTPLMRAAAIGHITRVKELLKEGADPNEPGPRNSTAVLFAAGSGHLDVVRELVENGADINHREEGGWNALEHALDDDDWEMIEFLKSA